MLIGLVSKKWKKVGNEKKMFKSLFNVWYTGIIHHKQNIEYWSDVHALIYDGQNGVLGYPRIKFFYEKI